MTPVLGREIVDDFGGGFRRYMIIVHYNHHILFTPDIQGDLLVALKLNFQVVTQLAYGSVHGFLLIGAAQPPRAVRYRFIRRSALSIMH